MMKEQEQESNFRRERGQVSKMALGSDMLQRWVAQNTLISIHLITFVIDVSPHAQFTGAL